MIALHPLNTAADRRVAYLVNQYPAVSHSFIRREILALERRGWSVLRVAIRGWDLPLVDAFDLQERPRTRYLLRDGLLPLFSALWRQALVNPRRLFGACSLTWAVARRSDRAFPVHLAYLAEACRLHDLMRRDGITHVHAHFATNPAEVAMLAAELGGITYSFAAHGSDIMDKPQQVALDLTVSRASFVAAVCSFGRNQIFRWVPHRAWDRVTVVRCGLEPGYGTGVMQAKKETRNTASFVCVGRLSKEKGQLLLLDALRLMKDQGLVLPSIVFAGDGPMRDELEVMVDLFGLRAFVRFTGWLNAIEVERELIEATALVVPSLSEGLPVVIMEAMACGTLVIAPYLAGIPELVIDNITGWLYPASDAAALADAMKRCSLVDIGRRDQMALAARERVWSTHNVDNAAHQLERLFLGAGCAARGYH